MNIDVFKAVIELRKRLSSVLEIKSIEVGFSNDDARRSVNTINITIFYKDQVLNKEDNFTTYIRDVEGKNMNLVFFEKMIIEAMKDQGIASLKKINYSFNSK